MKAKAEKSKFYYSSLIISSLCLLIPAFYNHYPLVNPDTATYIESGFMPAMPGDRPITYGLLIRLFTLNGLSLWLLTLAQAYMISWLIFRILKNLSGGGPYILKSLLTVFLLSLCTSLSWIVSQVQPDVFTSIAFLCIVVLLMGKEDKKTNNLLYGLYFFSVAVHLSHPLLMIVELLFLLIFRIYVESARTKPRKKIIILLALSFASILVMITPLHKSKHIFFMGSLLEKGVLKKYLDDNCAAKNYKLCAYKDVLPTDANVFWWDTNSPLYKIGDWKSVKPEFNEIIRGIFTNQAYIKLYLVSTIRQAKQQAITFNIGDGNQSFPPGSYVCKTILAYFPHEVNWFNNDVQNKRPMLELLATPNKVFVFVIVCGLLGLVYLLIKWKHLSAEMKLVLIVCISGIILNCLDCAAFGTVNGRYGCKMIWLIPFCVIAFILNKLPRRTNHQNDRPTVLNG